MIRHATIEDTPALVAMAREFIQYGNHPIFMSITDEQLAQRVADLMSLGDAVTMLVAEVDGRVVGMLVGTLTAPWFAPSTVMAAELAWWVQPEARGTTVAVRLVKEYEAWAINHGAQIIAMSSLNNGEAERVANMLRRMGYAQSERTYTKETR